MKKEKEDIRCEKDIQKLEKNEREKWEVAVELGLFDKVLKTGWKSLTAKESGRVGGIIASRHDKKRK